MEGPDGRHSQVDEGEYPIKVSMQEQDVEDAAIKHGRVRTDQVAGDGEGAFVVAETWRNGDRRRLTEDLCVLSLSISIRGRSIKTCAPCFSV